MRQRRGPRTAPVLLVDAVWARRVVAELDRAGLRASELLRAVGLRREQLTAPDALIPFDAHVRLFENATSAMRSGVRPVDREDAAGGAFGQMAHELKAAHLGDHHRDRLAEHAASASIPPTPPESVPLL